MREGKGCGRAWSRVRAGRRTFKGCAERVRVERVRGAAELERVRGVVVVPLEVAVLAHTHIYMYHALYICVRTT